MPPPSRTFWQRVKAGARRLLPRAWRGESIGGDEWGYPVHPLDLYDGIKGIEHSLYSMIAAWRRRCGPQGTQPSTSVSDQNVRDLARLLERYNPFAQSMLSALRCYVLADQGMAIEVSIRDDLHASPDEVAVQTEAQSYLDRFMDADDWWSRERELLTRCHRDGEGILRYFRTSKGVRLRFVEPECIVPPDSSPEWTDGVRLDPDDAEMTEAIWVQTGTTRGEGEEVPADEFYFIRANADRCLKRGLSDFASVAGLCTKALDCLSAMIGAETERQSIVMVTHHEQSAPADLDGYIAGQTDYIERGFTSQGGGAREMPVQASRGVKERHLTGAQRLAAIPDPGSISGAINAINTAMLTVGARYHMPLWVITGDASRNNALDLQAEGPFGKFIADLQAWFSRHVRNILWHVLEIGVESGELAAATLDVCDLAVTPQRSTEMRDPTQETARNKMLYDAGLMGKPSWSAREGLDFDAEQEDLKRYGGPPAAPAIAVPSGMKAVPPGTPPEPSVNGNGQGGPQHV